MRVSTAVGLGVVGTGLVRGEVTMELMVREGMVRQAMEPVDIQTTTEVELMGLALAVKAVIQEVAKELDHMGQDLAMELLQAGGQVQLQLVERLSNPRMELLQGAGATTRDTR